jgi:plastocyanin
VLITPKESDFEFSKRLTAVLCETLHKSPGWPGRHIALASPRRQQRMSFRFGYGVILCAGLLLTACGSDSSSPTTPSTPTTPAGTGASASASIVNGAFGLTTTAFSPNPLSVPVGTTITWINNDVTTHNATATGGSFATGSIAPGGSASVKLQTAGSFVYHCTIHPGMVATINVQ